MRDWDLLLLGIVLVVIGDIFILAAALDRGNSSTSQHLFLPKTTAQAIAHRPKRKHQSDTT